jgi:hypothetical protein
VGKAARFSVEMNMTLAAYAHRQKPHWWRLAQWGLRMGPMSWCRYLRDSRIAERVAARLHLMAVLTAPGPNPTPKLHVPNNKSKTLTPTATL